MAQSVCNENPLHIRTLFADEILLQVMDVVNDGELPDASASFLPPPLLKQLSCSTTAISSHTRPHLANKVLKTQLVSRIEAVKPERSFRKSRKPLYTAAVDEGMLTVYGFNFLSE